MTKAMGNGCVSHNNHDFDDDNNKVGHDTIRNVE